MSLTCCQPVWLQLFLCVHVCCGIRPRYRRCESWREWGPVLRSPLPRQGSGQTSLSVSRKFAMLSWFVSYPRLPVYIPVHALERWQFFDIKNQTGPIFVYIFRLIGEQFVFVCLRLFSYARWKDKVEINTIKADIPLFSASNNYHWSSFVSIYLFGFSIECLYIYVTI